MIFITGVLAGLLVAAVVANVAQWRASRSAVKAALQHEQALLDRARAAELRSERQIDTMLARVSTQARLELRPGSDTPAPDPEARKFISDLPTDDEAWNDYRGEADEELS